MGHPSLQIELIHLMFYTYILDRGTPVYRNGQMCSLYRTSQRVSLNRTKQRCSPYRTGQRDSLIQLDKGVTFTELDKGASLYRTGHMGLLQENFTEGLYLKLSKATSL